MSAWRAVVCRIPKRVSKKANRNLVARSEAHLNNIARRARYHNVALQRALCAIRERSLSRRAAQRASG